MGNSTFTSNVVAGAGTETIRGFATVSATDLTTTGKINPGSYIQLGSSGTMYIMWGSAGSASASVVAFATSLVATSNGLKGSLVLNSDDGRPWTFTADTTAASIA